MRLSPRDPLIGFWHAMLGDAELNLGHFDASIDQYHKAIDVGFRAFIPYANLAAVYALEGKMEETKAPLGEARRLNPGYTVKWAIAHAPNIPPKFEGLRKAGLQMRRDRVDPPNRAFRRKIAPPLRELGLR
jgi:adenylate cyclase